MNSELKKELEIYATQIRMGVIESTYCAQSGHPGGSLSAADVFAYLYGKEMRYNPKDPKWEDRDRFVLSKGHCAPGVYSALAYKGFFPVEALKTLRKSDSFLQGHPNMNTVPGIDMSTGSLGQGVSVAAGMANAAKFLKKDINVYTVLGDGESQEGQVWEAFMYAAHYKLDNLCVIIDYNNLQIDGRTTEVMNIQPLDEKLKAFGFEVCVINGNDFDEIDSAFEKFHANKGKPFAIIMNTVKGKGVSFMEDVCGWHGKAPNEENYKTAMAELNAKLKELEA
ncbi:MAG: transketolase [Eubacterium sp.]|nr:transketolase [Eubacterium sp.]